MSTVSPTSGVTPPDLADALSALRERPPLVQCLTNIVVAGWTANVLLAGGTGGREVESVDSPEAAADVARDLAEQQQSVIAVSGPIDHITDGKRMVRLSNGHRWLTQVTGVGCALGALEIGQGHGPVRHFHEIWDR